MGEGWGKPLIHSSPSWRMPDSDLKAIKNSIVYCKSVRKLNNDDANVMLFSKM